MEGGGGGGGRGENAGRRSGWLGVVVVVVVVVWKKRKRGAREMEVEGSCWRVRVRDGIMRGPRDWRVEAIRE